MATEEEVLERTAQRMGIGTGFVAASKAPPDPSKQFMIVGIEFDTKKGAVVFLGNNLKGERRKFELAVDATDEENLRLYPYRRNS